MKIIIQCELYESPEEGQNQAPQEPIALKGLCMTCYKAETCHLPDKQFGVWHCEEYE